MDFEFRFTDDVEIDYDLTSLVFRKTCASFVNGVFANVYEFPLRTGCEQSAFLRGCSIYIFNMLDRGARGQKLSSMNDATNASITWYSNTYNSICTEMKKKHKESEFLIAPSKYEDCLRRIVDFRHNAGAHFKNDYESDLSIRDIATASMISAFIFLNLIWRVDSRDTYIVHVDNRPSPVIFDDHLFDLLKLAFIKIESTSDAIITLADNADIMTFIKSYYHDAISRHEVNDTIQNLEDFCFTVGVATYCILHMTPNSAIRNSVIHMNYYYDIGVVTRVDNKTMKFRMHHNYTGISNALNEQIKSLIGF